MGYRANVVTQERSYGSQIFSNWQQFDDYFAKLQDLYPDAEIFCNESNDFYEISKEVVEQEIERLDKDRDAEFEFQAGFANESWRDKNGEIADAWRNALKQSPKDSTYVSLEWW